MHKNLSLPTLSLIISCSLIFTGCSDNKSEINRQNSQLITGLIFWGSIKSVKSTFNTTSDGDEQKRSAEGNMFIQYTSDCELTNYHYDSVVYMGQNESTYFSKMVMKSSFDKSTLLSKKMSSTFYDKNGIENLIITTDFYYSASEESKQINNIRTISNKHSPKTNIQHVFWENNRVDRVSGQDYQGLKTSIKYNYNKQGNLVATIDSEVA